MMSVRAIESYFYAKYNKKAKLTNPKLFNIAVDYKISLSLHSMPFLVINWDKFYQTLKI